MNQTANIKPIKTKYNKTIKILSTNILRLSIDLITNFMGFSYFYFIHDYINAKTCSKMLRLSDNNGITQFIYQIKNTWTEWNNNHRMIFDKERSNK